MDQSSSKGKKQTTLNINYQKEIQQLFSENKTLKTQIMLLNEKISALLQTAIQTQQENNQLKQEISTKSETQKVQIQKIEEKINQFALQFHSNIQQNQNNRDFMEVEKETKLVKNQYRQIYQDADSVKRKDIQQEIAHNQKQLKKQKQKSFVSTCIDYIVLNKVDLQKKIVLRTGTTLSNNRSKQQNIEKMLE